MLLVGVLLSGGGCGDGSSRTPVQACGDASGDGCAGPSFPQSCGSGAGSFTDDCRKVGRACTQSSEGARCGMCLEGLVEDGAVCRLPRGCAAVGCANQNRACVEAVSGQDAVCGACLLGYQPVTGGDCAPVAGCEDCGAQKRECVLAASNVRCGSCRTGYREGVNGGCEPTQTCAALACEAGHLTCIEADGTARCSNQCSAGYVRDDVTGGCRKVVDCTTLSCPAGETCVPGDGAKDAVCSGAGCGRGSGRDDAGACRRCKDGVPALCDGKGETGVVLAVESKDGSDCICETRPGYFPGSSGNAAVPCDLDGDGWVRESALPSIESTFSLVARNARCELQVAGSVVFHSEGGGSQAVPLDTPLPLYESDRNDGALPETSLPVLGGRRPTSRALNSLTKVCAGVDDDANHNGISDVGEWASKDSRGGGALRSAVRANSVLESYFEAYARFSYFVETHIGWFEPAMDDGPGTYHIQEQGRALQLPFVESPSRPNTWRSCTRHQDYLYRDQPRSFVGGDFAWLEDTADQPGMLHHSQFKCVVALPQQEYADGANTARDMPTTVEKTDAGGVFQLEGGLQVSLPWTFNNCGLRDEAAPATTGTSSTPLFECASVAKADLPLKQPVWALVRFENAGNQASTDYRRGCINECVERAALADAAGNCKRCTMDAFGVGTLAPDTTDVRDDANPCTKETCSSSGATESTSMTAGTPCPQGVCNDLGGCGVCLPGAKMCGPSGPLTCSAQGTWEPRTCTGGCVNGECTVCAPGSTRACSPALRNPAGSERCGASGLWSNVCECPPGQASRSFFVDADGDGAGGPTTRNVCPTASGAAPPGYANAANDCDDYRAVVAPGKADVCGDGWDNDCQDSCDTGCTTRVTERMLCPVSSSRAYDCPDVLLTDYGSTESYPGLTNPPNPHSFFLYTAPIPGGRALYRCVWTSGGVGWHIVTTNKSACTGLRLEADPMGYTVSRTEYDRAWDIYTDPNENFTARIEHVVQFVECESRRADGKFTRMLQRGTSCSGRPTKGDTSVFKMSNWSKVTGGDVYLPVDQCWRLR